MANKCDNVDIGYVERMFKQNDFQKLNSRIVAISATKCFGVSNLVSEMTQELDGYTYCDVLLRNKKKNNSLMNSTISEKAQKLLL